MLRKRGRAPITPLTALPGETINILATGLGLICSSPVVNNFCTVIPDPGLSAIVDGLKSTRAQNRTLPFR